MRRLLFHRYILQRLLLLLTVTCFVACTKDAGTVSMDDVKPEPVNFDTYLQNSSQTTRATYPSADMRGLQQTDNVKLHEGGFSVFALYSEGSTYQHGGAATGRQAFNFMWNQAVEWDALLSGSYVTKWRYTPVKYWPNDNTPADDQQADSGNDPATGSRLHSYLSFFAYAPFTQADALGGVGADDDGIVGLTANDAQSSASYVTYRLPESLKPSRSVDLLWSMQPNRYKTDGGGYTTGTVDFQFVHALSRLDFLVRGVFDHVTPDDTELPYPATLDAKTKILVERVEILSPTLHRQAEMLLTPQTGLGTTANPYPAVPQWQNRSLPMDMLALEPVDLNDDLVFGSNPADTDDPATALTAFGNLPAGVISVDKPLLAAGADQSRLVMPTADAGRLKVRVVYRVITYDERLALNTPRYFSIVSNDITQESETSVQFLPNKVYTLRLLLGLTTVKFEVVAVDDWAVPITLNPVVYEPDVVTRELDVTE